MCTSAVRFLDYRDFPNANQGNREGLDPFEASSKKSIEPAHAGVHVRPMARQGAQLAERRDEFVKLREIGSRDWFTAHPLVLFNHRGNDNFAFFGLQRTCAIHDGATRFGQFNRAVEKSPLNGRQKGDIARCLAPWNIWVPSDGAGGSTRCVD